MDKLEKIEKDGVLAIIGEERAALLDLLGSEAPMEALEAYGGKNALLDEGLSELRAVLSALPLFGVPAENFTADLTIARGLDYYTGTVYETMLLDHPEVGSVCSGGRYDDLAEYYTNRKLPGVGISIGLTRLFYILDEQGLLYDGALNAPADAIVIPMTADFGPAIGAATALRAAGVRTQLYCEDRKFKAKMAYADRLGIPFAVILGEDEIAEGVVSLKDMISGGQVKLTAPDAAARIRAAAEDMKKSAIVREN